jgi:hypothetical protein
MIKQRWDRFSYKQLLRLGLALGITALAVWLLVRELEWEAVVSALRSANYRWVALGMLAIVGTFFARAWRWQALLCANADLRLLPTMTAILVGQVVNTALPMRSGDLARAMWVGQEEGTSASEALGSIALEKVWDLLAVFLCGLILLVAMPLPDWFTQSTWGTALMLFIAGGILWAGLRWKAVFFHWAGWVLAHLPQIGLIRRMGLVRTDWDQTLLPRLRRLAQGLESVLNAEASARAFLWTMLYWILGTVTNWAVIQAFDITLGGASAILAALFLIVALMVGGAAVPTPGRLGVFEGLCVVSLALFDVPADQALAVGLVLHLVVLVPPFLAAAGLAFLSGPRARRASSSDAIASDDYARVR